MIIISSKGYKVSSESANLDPKNPNYMCPKCGCVYQNITDIKSLYDKHLETEDRYPPMLCNECGTELVDICEE